MDIRHFAGHFCVVTTPVALYFNHLNWMQRLIDLSLKYRALTNYATGAVLL